MVQQCCLLLGTFVAVVARGRRLVLVVMFVSTVSSTCGAAPVPPVRFLRVVVLDVSGSMDGPNIAVAKEEILGMAKQLPPAADQPLLIIPFHSKVDQVHRFTDLPALETYLKKLKPSGGTSIASGLRHALAEIRPYDQTTHVCIMLFTDGEDSDQDAIAAEEQRLDQLFAERQKRGFKSTVVFCKRWDQANAKLVKAITDKGHAHVIDAGQLRLVPLTLTPVIQATHASWDAQDPGLLHVAFSARIDVRGIADAQKLPLSVPVRCVYPAAAGDIQADLTPSSGQAVALTVRLPVDAATRTTAQRLDVPFQLAEPRETATKTALYLPVLPSEVVRVPVPLPAQVFQVRLQGKLAAAGRVHWADPLARTLAVPLSLTLDTAVEPATPWRQPVVLRLVPGNGQRLVGPPTVSIAGAGSQTLAVTLEAPCPAGIATVPLALSVVPEQPPATHRFQPAQVALTHTATAPPPVTTTIEGRALSVTAPAWTDLATGTAAFTARIEVRVDGPLAPDTTLTLRCPASVRELRLEPGVVKTGTQTIEMHLQAAVRPGPQRNEFVFTVTPPAAQGAVQIAPPAPWRFGVAGPPPAPLLLWNGQADPRVLTVTAPDDATTVLLPVLPVLAGQSASVARGLCARVQGTGPLKIDGAADLPLFREAALQVVVPAGVQRSFFHDTCIEGEVSVAPTASGLPVTAAKQQLIVVLEAPCKRLVMYLAIVAGVASAVFVVLWLLLKFKAVEKWSPDASE